MLGHRLKVGALVPSTNTVVEPEYHRMCPPGVTVHTSRLLVADPDLGSDDAFARLMEQIHASTGPAIAGVRTARPDVVALGMTAVAFVGGAAGNRELTARLAGLAGVPVVTGPTAVVAALRSLGVRRIAVLSPYQPYARERALALFAEEGFTVTAEASLASTHANAIAAVPTGQLAALIDEVDSDAAEAIVQIGTNLPMVRLLDGLEARLGKPVIAVNAATIWYVLRAYGIEDRRPGAGSLLGSPR